VALHGTHASHRVVTGRVADEDVGHTFGPHKKTGRFPTLPPLRRNRKDLDFEAGWRRTHFVERGF